MKVVVLGDVHGRWQKVNLIVDRELGPGGVALSTGDLSSYGFEPARGQKMVFCPGNHEDFEYLKKLMGSREGSLVPLGAGERFELEGGASVAALPGVFSPHFFERGGKQRYFSRDDMDKLLGLDEPLDILLTHEAPLGAGVERGGRDAGKEQVNALIERLEPKVLFFGHHHAPYDASIGPTRVVGLDYPHRSYVRLDTSDFSLERVSASLDDKLGYRYAWEEPQA